LKKIILSLAIIGLFNPMIVCAADIAAAANDVHVPSYVHIRSLAASCAACHGTEGNAVSGDKDAVSILALAGVSKADIISKLQTFKSGERSATVMHRHAKGLTADEITALADYFSMQVPHLSVTLKPQSLRLDHAN
jgi:sulfide dehydrogenase cytochrome subunit